MEKKSLLGFVTIGENLYLEIEKRGDVTIGEKSVPTKEEVW